jgi:uncharacterized protein YhaN
MKIRSMHIRSFGRLTDVPIKDIPDGLVLITGNNESGKTTMMEFMRSTIFPPSAKKRALYPLPAESDSGTIEMETESGERLILIREGKKVSELKGKDLPGERFALDSDTYNSIFAMDLEDLADAEKISSGSIRNRFLTIPGGEKVPETISDIDSQRKDLMNDDRITVNNPVGRIREEITTIGGRIMEIRSLGDDYDACVQQMNDLIAKKGAAESIQDAIDSERTRRSTLEAQRINVNTIDDLMAESRTVEYAAALSEDVIKEHAGLESELARLNDDLKECDGAPPFTDDKLRRIKDTETKVSSFLMDRRDEDRNAPSDASPPAAPKAAGIPLIPIILFIASGICFAASVFEIWAAAAGAALAVMGALVFMMRRKNAPITGNSDVKADRMPAAGGRENDIRREAEAVLNEENIPFTGIEDAAEALRNIIEKQAVRAADIERMNAVRDKIAQNEGRISSMVKDYGGKEGFAKASADRSRFFVIGSTMGTLKSSVESATGMSLQQVVQELRTVHAEGSDVKAEISQADQDIGKLQAKLDDIRSDERLNRLLTEKDAKETELRDKIIEWGTLSLQKFMIDRSCDELYEKMQPSVISAANRYLDMMTGGRYVMDIDPRRGGDITIRDTRASEYKTPKQWSSGLSDQVHLSIKMAVAKEMGSERLPMILDDVLVRFDRGRKRSACEAMLEFAKDQQVFLFSCTPLDDMMPPGAQFKQIMM